MRLVLLTMVAMAAFAGNSLLNRWAVGGGHIDPQSFAALRVAAGAAVLVLIARAQGQGLPIAGWPRIIAVAGLGAYMIGFSAAYTRLDAGTGALILFATVQVTMFLGAVAAGEAIPGHRVAGALVAFGGLCLLLWPGAGAVPGIAAAAPMLVAGLGWGVYSLTGRLSASPLGATAGNFLLCLPLMLAALPFAPAIEISPGGLAVALFAGAVTSGLGYALWFSVVPALGATRAAVWQLTVPVIALMGGAALLRETPEPPVLVATAIVIGGVMLALRR